MTRRACSRVLAILAVVIFVASCAAGSNKIDSPLQNAVGGSGKSSPEGAVREFIASVEQRDPLGLLAILHPAERSLLGDTYARAVESVETGPTPKEGSPVKLVSSVDDVLRAVDLELEVGDLKVERLAEHLAWVQADGVSVDASVDFSALDKALGVDFDAGDLDGSGSLSFPSEVGIAAVNAGESWYVSGLYTAAEHGRRALGLPPRFATGKRSKGATDPSSAVTGLADAVASKRIREVAARLDLFEGQLLLDYETTLGSELQSAVTGLDITATPSHVSVVDEDADTAVVEVDRWSLSASGTIGGNDGEYDEPSRVDVLLDIDGLCRTAMTYNDYDDEWHNSAGCAFKGPGDFDPATILVDEGWRGPRFVVVRDDDGWRVSLLRTLANLVAPYTKDPLTLATSARMVGFDESTPGVERAVISTIGSTLEPIAPGEQGDLGLFANERLAIGRVGGSGMVTVSATSVDACSLEVIVDGEDYDDDCDDGTLSVPGGAILFYSDAFYHLGWGVGPLSPITLSVR